MTQVGELVTKPEIPDPDKEDCVFEHKEPAKLENDLKGNSTTLRGKMADVEGNGKSTQLWGYSDDNKKIIKKENRLKPGFPMPDIATKIEVSGTDESKAEYSFTWDAHHLIPTNSSYKKADIIHRYVEEGDHISGDIGYDINGGENGIWLPRIKPVAKSASEEIMRHCKCQAHQWDNSHSQYSDFVMKVLNRVSESIRCGIALCKDCNAKNKDGKADPPHGLVRRFNMISTRLRGLLKGEASSWRSPIFTSNYAYEYALRVQNVHQKKSATP